MQEEIAEFCNFVCSKDWVIVICQNIACSKGGAQLLYKWHHWFVCVTDYPLEGVTLKGQIYYKDYSDFPCSFHGFWNSNQFEVLEIKDKLSNIAIKQLWLVTKRWRAPLFCESG